jgi:hypothetical protein
MKCVLSSSTVLLVLISIGLHPQAHAQTTFAVGQKVDAGGGYRHKATVLKAKPPSYFLHYDDGSLPDGWEQGYAMRPRTNGSGSGAPAKAGADGAIATPPSENPKPGGPRNGKYSIYVYSTSGRPMYNGYFVLNGGTYEVFLPGGKPGGSGRYHFAADTKTMEWISGPFANSDWNGTQQFEVDGDNQKIRLRRNTVGWSTGR